VTAIFESLFSALRRMGRGDFPGGNTNARFLRARSHAIAQKVIRDRPSLAVLPLTNMSDDGEQDILADGMTEDIITALSRDPRLFVIARNSSFSYKGQSPNIRSVGRELGVQYVLEGSVRRVGDKLRVTGQMIDAETGAHVWADALDRPLAEIFALQDEITAGIVASITSHLTLEINPTAQRMRPGSLESWQLYAKALGKYAAISRNPEGYREVELLLRDVVRKDSHYAPAWALLGTLIAWRWVFAPAGFDSTADEREAQSCIERAETLAPLLSETLCARGTYLLTSGRPAEAVTALRKAIERNPNDVVPRGRLALALCNCGEPAAALEEVERVLRLSPRDPIAAVYYLYSAQCRFALGDFDGAERLYRMASATTQKYPMALVGLGMSLAALERLPEARKAIGQALAMVPGMSHASVEHAYQKLSGYNARVIENELKYLAMAWPE
jgi:TolB-like protein/Tfp pilus assembly protein PilF